MDQEPAISLQAGGYCFGSLLLLNEQDWERVHPDDLTAVQNAYPHGWQLLCFQYGGRHLGYDLLDDGALQMRVRDAVIQPIPTPRFKRCESVFAHPKQAVGVIRQTVWHLKRECVYYLVEFDGQRSRRWYFESELTALGDDQSGPASEHGRT